MTGLKLQFSTRNSKSTVPQEVTASKNIYSCSLEDVLMREPVSNY